MSRDDRVESKWLLLKGAYESALTRPVTMGMEIYSLRMSIHPNDTELIKRFEALPVVKEQSERMLGDAYRLDEPGWEQHLTEEGY